jgi:hypothetical protein
MRQKYRVIVEGMDGSGKTTLIGQLRGLNHRLELVRNPLDDKQDFNAWWPMEMDRTNTAVVPIHDRFFYSELVYGPIIRGRINAENILVQNVLWALRSNSLLIYARPSTDILREGIQTNSHMEGVKERFVSLLELYDQLMGAEQVWYGNRFVHYVWNRENELERVDGIVRSYMNGELG